MTESLNTMLQLKKINDAINRRILLNDASARKEALERLKRENSEVDMLQQILNNRASDSSHPAGVVEGCNSTFRSQIQGPRLAYSEQP